MEGDLVDISLPNGAKIVDSVRLGGGGNNRTYRASFDDGSVSLVKCYLKNPKDSRDRLGTEYLATQFMESHGIGNIPRAISIDRQKNRAIYSFEVGEPKILSDLTVADVDQALRFAQRLKDLSKLAEAEALPVASEACFSTDEILMVLIARIGRIQDVITSDEAENCAELSTFMQKDLLPFFRETETRARLQSSSLNTNLKQPVPLGERTLSPSDFGFHNGIFSREGKWIFYDFEYFGWDDPCKLICDFVLHPGMNLSMDLSTHFLKGAVELFGTDASFTSRLELQYPLWGIKWCTILLNQFIPEHRSRREFADDRAKQEAVELKMRQLTKAKAMLNNIKASYDRFFDIFGLR